MFYVLKKAEFNILKVRFYSTDCCSLIEFSLVLVPLDDFGNSMLVDKFEECFQFIGPLLSSTQWMLVPYFFWLQDSHILIESIVKLTQCLLAPATVETVVYLKDTAHLTWRQICSRTRLSNRTARRWYEW